MLLKLSSLFGLILFFTPAQACFLSLIPSLPKVERQSLVQLGFSSELQAIEAALPKLNYEYVDVGDTQEQLRFFVGRLLFNKEKIQAGEFRKVSETFIVTDNKAQLPYFLKLLESKKLTQSYLNFLNQPMAEPYLIRAQVHDYTEPGNFISAHNDSSSDEEFRISGFVMLSSPEEYEGGELIVYNDESLKKSRRYKPQKGEMLLMDPNAFHEVRPIKSGRRKVLVFFIGIR